ncbi:MAG: hypothetical protein ACLP3C_03795 [Mycobacterium sp.]|uniref:hypothetical protein n=1 Tax=Mycobacterium sp. TaxID=1785 RepID=UPI003F9CACE8
MLQGLSMAVEDSSVAPAAAQSISCQPLVVVVVVVVVPEPLVSPVAPATWCACRADG